MVKVAIIAYPHHGYQSLKKSLLIGQLTIIYSTTENSV